MIYFYKMMVAFFFQAVLVSSVVAGGLYSPRTISVDETASTAVIAKQIAFGKARTQAWNALLNDLSLVEIDALPALTDKEMNSVIQTIDVNGEKTRNNRYIADFVIYFNPKQVRAMLRRKNINFTEERAFPVLIVPVWKQNGVTKIYEIGNVWREALSQNPKSGGLLPVFFVPEGAKASLRIDKTVLKDPQKLTKVAKNYGTEGAVVSSLSVKHDATNVTLTLHWHSVGGFLNDSQGKEVKVVPLNKDYNGEVVRLVYDFYASLEKRWRVIQEQSRSAGNNEQKIMFATGGVEDLQSLKQDLKAVASIESAYLQGLQGGLATFLVRFYLTKEKFFVALSRLGYTIQKGKAIWVAERP